MRVFRRNSLKARSWLATKKRISSPALLARTSANANASRKQLLISTTRSCTNARLLVTRSVVDVADAAEERAVVDSVVVREDVVEEDVAVVVTGLLVATTVADVADEAIRAPTSTTPMPSLAWAVRSLCRVAHNNVYWDESILPKRSTSAMLTWELVFWRSISADRIYLWGVC